MIDYLVNCSGIAYFEIFILLAFILYSLFLGNTLTYKGINDPKTLTLIEFMQLICYIPLSILSRSLINEIDTWAIVFLIVSYSYFKFVPWILNLSLPRLNLRNIRKQPQDVNYFIWTLFEICIYIMFISYIIVLFYHAEVQYYSVVLSLNYCFKFGSKVVLYLILFGSPIWVIMLLNSYRKNRLANSYQTISEVKSNTSPIIYLRAFGLDENPSINLKTFDESLFYESNNAVVISLADPKEIIPSGGSIKIQSKDDDWKDAVSLLLKQARAVIIVLGDTDGLKWEISQLKNYLRPSQLFIVIPSYYYLSMASGERPKDDDSINYENCSSLSKNFDHVCNCLLYYKRNIIKYNKLWGAFCEELNKEGYHVDNKFPGFKRVITFNSQWESINQKNKFKEKDIIPFIINNTDGNSLCNYNELTEKLSRYEVNGFVPEKYVSTYRAIINKILTYYGISALFLSSIILIFYFLGVNVFYSNHTNNDMDSKKCGKAYHFFLTTNNYYAFESLMSKSYVSFTVLNNTSPAYKKGLRGEYILLEYGDWNQDSFVSIKDKARELSGKPKRILVMKDGIISSYFFENNIGVNFEIKGTDENTKKGINIKYQKWKEENR